MSESMSNFWFVVTSLAQSPLLQVPAAVCVLVFVSVSVVKVFRWAVLR